MYITFNFNSIGEILSLAAFAFSVYSVYICIQNHREINRQIKKHENKPDQNRIPGHPNPPPPPTK